MKNVLDQTNSTKTKCRLIFFLKYQAWKPFDCEKSKKDEKQCKN